VKRVFANNNESIHNKYRIYDVLNNMSHYLNLVRSFYRILFVNFLQYLSDNIVDQRLEQHQIRNSSNDQVIKMTKSESKSLI
jgi:hypothetical protein